MRVPSHPTQIRRMLTSRLKQLTPTGPILAATLSEVSKRCGQPSCACHRDGPLHIAHHLSLKVDGKRSTVYVPQDMLGEVRSWVEEYQRLKAVTHEITQLTLALVRGHVADRKRRLGRS